MVWCVGLGNPGEEYAGSRHNLGFEIVDRVARLIGTQFQSGTGEYRIARGSFKNRGIGLVKPLTYMNNSGEAVLDILERYSVPLDQLLILCDDFQLPLGRIRLRPGGSDGGHNGLYSILYHLKSSSFPRLRCGIASPTMPADKTLMAAFVLAPFARDERPIVDEMVARASEATLVFSVEGLQKAMNLYNTDITTP
ncbi:MAG: aminoacyl-tRNA hydrolase [Ignavibacteriales bacterium]|nr:aminoacyl-tRNA hydrolase [Ignavibacteriales bacterium]